MLSTIVVDAHAMFVDLLCSSLEGRYGLDIVATATTARAAAKACAAHRPDLLILNPDLSDGSGLRVLPVLADVSPYAKVILLVDGQSRSRVHDTAPKHQSVHVIIDTSTGLRDLFSAVVDLLEAIGKAPPSLRAEKMLSGREMDVFTRIGRGMTSAEIAAELGISLQTVETHRKSVTKKFQAVGSELVRLAVLHVAARDGRPFTRQSMLSS